MTIKNPASMLLAGFVSGLLSQIPPHQHLQQLITVDLADECAGTHVVGDIGGIFGENITNDLIDGVIAFFLQSPRNEIKRDSFCPLL